MAWSENEVTTGSSAIFRSGMRVFVAQSDKPPDAQLSGVADSTYVPVHKFDSKRDAAADIQAAITEAQRSGKRILLDVGGDWCQYCHQMDQLFQERPELLELPDKNFITVPVYYRTD